MWATGPPDKIEGRGAIHEGCEMCMGHGVCVGDATLTILITLLRLAIRVSVCLPRILSFSVNQPYIQIYEPFNPNTTGGILRIKLLRRLPNLIF